MEFLNADRIYMPTGEAESISINGTKIWEAAIEKTADVTNSFSFTSNRTRPMSHVIMYGLCVQSGRPSINNICRVSVNNSKWNMNGVEVVDLSDIKLCKVGSATDVFDAVNGSLTRAIDVVDLGNCTWTYNGVRFRATLPTPGKSVSASVKANIMCEAFSAMSQNDYVYNDNAVGMSTDGSAVLVRCSAFSDVLSFKNAMSGIKLYYEISNPTFSMLDPQPVYQINGENTFERTSGTNGVKATVVYVGKR